jgi:hypothetical protein
MKIPGKSMWSDYNLTGRTLGEGQDHADTEERILTLNSKDWEREECVMCYVWHGNTKVWRTGFRKCSGDTIVHFHKGGNVRILLKSIQMYSNECSRMFILSAHILHLNLTWTPFINYTGISRMVLLFHYFFNCSFCIKMSYKKCYCKIPWVNLTSLTLSWRILEYPTICVILILSLNGNQSANIVL